MGKDLGLEPQSWRMMDLCRALGGGSGLGPCQLLWDLPRLLGPFSGSQKWPGLQRNETQFISAGLEPCQAPKPGTCLGSLWSGVWPSHTTQALFLALHPSFPGGCLLPPVQAPAGWETGQTCSQQGSLGRPGMGFSFYAQCAVVWGRGFWVSEDPVFPEGLFGHPCTFMFQKSQRRRKPRRTSKKPKGEEGAVSHPPGIGAPAPLSHCTEGRHRDSWSSLQRPLSGTSLSAVLGRARKPQPSAVTWAAGPVKVSHCTHTSRPLGWVISYQSLFSPQGQRGGQIGLSSPLQFWLLAKCPTFLL